MGHTGGGCSDGMGESLGSIYPLLCTIAGWYSSEAVDGVWTPSLLLESSGDVRAGRLLVERLGR